MKIYDYIYYVIYKCIKLTTPESQKHAILFSSIMVISVNLIMIFSGLIISLSLLKNVEINYNKFLIIFFCGSISIYLLNRIIFLRKKRYQSIEKYFDETNRLEKKHFILLNVLFMLVGLSAVIGSGIYYSSS